MVLFPHSLLLMKEKLEIPQTPAEGDHPLHSQVFSHMSYTDAGQSPHP
jgi:hypothetical protein